MTIVTRLGSVGILGSVFLVGISGDWALAQETTAMNGAIDVSSTWTGSPTVPTSGTSDGAVWQIVNGHNVNSGGGSFAGATLEVNDGRLSLQSDLTVRDLVLNPMGQIWQDNTTRTLSGDTLTLNGGTIHKDRRNNLVFQFDTINGSGSVLTYGNNPNRPGELRFEQTMTSTNPLADFTGEFVVDYQNGSSPIFTIGFDIPDSEASFGVRLTDVDVGDGLQTGQYTHGRYLLQNDVAFTSFIFEDFNSDGTEVLSYSLEPGTYALDDTVLATNMDYIDLSDVDGNDFTDFFVGWNESLPSDFSGTITVAAAASAAVPEPHTMAIWGMLALAMVGFAACRRQRSRDER